MCYLYTMEIYSAIQKNEILPFAGKWTELENFILSEVRFKKPKAGNANKNHTNIPPHPC
jgi:hypothetical protein